jgi:hypothetical protein
MLEDTRRCGRGENQRIVVIQIRVDSTVSSRAPSGLSGSTIPRSP